MAIMCVKSNCSNSAHSCHCIHCLAVFCTVVQLQLTTVHLAQPIYGDDVDLSMQQQLCMLLHLHTTCRHAELPIATVLNPCVWVMLGSANVILAAEAWTLWTSQYNINIILIYTQYIH